MPIRDVAIYARQNIPRPPFYVQDLLIKQGSMIVFGQSGIKKSWLVEHLAFCLATGCPWLGFTTEQARVLIVNFEISDISYQIRLKAMLERFELPEQRLYVCSPNRKMLEERGTFEWFADEVRPFAPQVIILDCLQGCFGGDENSTREMTTWINNIEQIMIEHQASVVVVHHENKNLLAVSARDRLRGSTRLPGWVDTEIRMVVQPTGTQLQFTKHRHSIRDNIPPLNIRFNNYNWEVF